MERKAKLPRLSLKEMSQLSENLAVALDKFQSQLQLDPKTKGTVKFVVPVSMMSGKWCATISLEAKMDKPKPGKE